MAYAFSDEMKIIDLSEFQGHDRKYGRLHRSDSWACMERIRAPSQEIFKIFVEKMKCFGALWHKIWDL